MSLFTGALDVFKENDAAGIGALILRIVRVSMVITRCTRKEKSRGPGVKEKKRDRETVTQSEKIHRSVTHNYRVLRLFDSKRNSGRNASSMPETTRRVAKKYIIVDVFNDKIVKMLRVKISHYRLINDETV